MKQLSLLKKCIFLFINLVQLRKVNKCIGKGTVNKDTMRQNANYDWLSAI